MYNLESIEEKYERYLYSEHDIHLDNKLRRWGISTLVKEIQEFISSYVEDTIGRSCEVLVKYKIGKEKLRKINIDYVELNFKTGSIVDVDVSKNEYLWSDFDEDDADLVYEVVDICVDIIDEIYDKLINKLKLNGIYYQNKFLLGAIGSIVRQYLFYLNELQERNADGIEDVIEVYRLAQRGAHEKFKYYLELSLKEMYDDFYSGDYGIKIDFGTPLQFIMPIDLKEIPYIEWGYVLVLNNNTEESEHILFKWVDESLKVKVHSNPKFVRNLTQVVNFLEDISKYFNNAVKKGIESEGQG